MKRRHDVPRDCIYHRAVRESPIIKDSPPLAGLSPLDVALRWPRERRLMMLHSGRAHVRWARWSILAEPTTTWRFDGRSRLISDAETPLPIVMDVRFTHDPLSDLDAILNATGVKARGGRGAMKDDMPFAGGWIGYFSYDLGRAIEPRAASDWRIDTEGVWPLIELAWCPAALVFDHVKRHWHSVGDCNSVVSELLPSLDGCDELQNAFALEPLEPTIDAANYRSLVARTIEYIRAGDVFQANIAQRFTAPFEGSTRALAVEAMRRSQPWFGAHLELAGEHHEPGRDARATKSDRAIVSLSPELFLQVDPITRQVITRPIKGTRAASRSVRELLDSAKDAAELHMIVDLMRNDLGRVCEFGSVRVPHARLIETHPTVHHGVGEITGTLRPGTSVGDLLRATFPGGSVTGAPKIRAMQIIDELERDHRGPYCGAIGFISDCGAMTLNVAIRTMLLRGEHSSSGQADHLKGAMDYWAGAGIVADSDPHAEHAECLDKATVMRSLGSASRQADAVAVT